RAASGGVRRSPLPSDSPSGWAERTGTIALAVLEDSKMETQVESGLRPKIQGRTARKAVRTAVFGHLRRSPVASLGCHVEIVLQRDLLEIGNQRIDPHVPAAGDCQRHLADMPEPVRLQRALPFD